MKTKLILGLCGIGVALILIFGGATYYMRHNKPPSLTVYCGVDEPYASQIFTLFEQRTGIHITAQYDIESSKSVGLAARLEAEAQHPQADVWWGSEAFLSVRLAEEGILTSYRPSTANDVPATYRDADGYWTGVGLRARVLAIADPPPPFAVTGLNDLLDPRLKGKICISRPTAGATGAQLAALYVTWGPDRTREFCKRLHDNGIALLGGNAEVADAVGDGQYLVGVTDSDDVSNSQTNGKKLTMVVPDQSGDGTLAMPTTVALVAGSKQSDAAKRLIDFLTSPEVEQKLIDLKFARWSVRGDLSGGLKAYPVNYHAAAESFRQAQRESADLMEGRATQ